MLCGTEQQSTTLSMIFHSPAGPMPHVPDNLTIPQFMFDYAHPCRPERGPDVPWMIDNDTGRQLFAGDLRWRTFALANSLKKKYNVGEDDVVLVFSRNHIDYPIMMWAVHVLGGIISGANPDFSVNELVYQINEIKPVVLVTLPDCLEIATTAAQSTGIPSERIIIFDEPSARVSPAYVTVGELIKAGSKRKRVFEERRLLPEEGKTKVAFFSFSSGTTGKPKAVAIPHYAVMTNVIQLASHNKVNEDYCSWEDRRFRPGDSVLGVLPLYHIYGNVITLHSTLFGAMTYVAFPKFNYVEMLESIMRYRITHLMLVPPLIVLLCKHPATEKYDIQRYIRYIISGAAPLTTEMNEQLFQMFPNAHIGQAYGMTETCTANIMFTIERKRGISGSSGVLVPGVLAKIVKADGTLGGYDEEGEIMIKTPSMALGYANNKQATKETFIDGWVRTGDVAKIRRDNQVFVIDRLKEIMKVKGFQVAPAELEGCLLDHPDIASACIVGIHDEYSGEVPLAFVVLKTTAADRVESDPKAAQNIKQSIIKHVADNKVSYKHLAGGVEFISSIPTSPSGKLLRRVLREKARGMRNKIASKL